MRYLLNLVYLFLLVALSPWIIWAAIRKGKYREGYSEKLLGRVPMRRGDRTSVWLHAVSVGEVNLLQPLVEELRHRQPMWECVVSTTTKAGMDLARRRYPELTVFYCPLDFSWAVAAAMRRIRPNLLVLAELELWPNLIRAAGEHGARIAIVNGRLSERSFRGYRRLRPLVSRVLAQIDCLAVQSETYANRFRDLGAPDASIHITGSIKFDGAQTNRSNPTTKQLRAIAGISDDNDIVFLAGSTQDPEERLAIDAFRKLSTEYPNLRLILVPRHPERFDEVARLLDREGLPFVRRSELDGANSTSRVLLVDVVGELGAWWGAAHIGFVGGSLTQRGGQNMIEPAAYGVATCFGPNTWNFADVAAALVAADAAHVVPGGDDLTAFVRRCLCEPQTAAELGDRAQSFVISQQGATDRTASLLESLLDQPVAQISSRPAA